MPETRKPEAHTELRRVDHDRVEDQATEDTGPEDRDRAATTLKPRTPTDKIPGDGDEVDELFNDVPV